MAKGWLPNGRGTPTIIVVIVPNSAPLTLIIVVVLLIPGPHKYRTPTITIIR